MDYYEGTLHWHSRTNRYWFNGDLFWQQQRGEYELRTDISTGYPTGFVPLPPDALRWLDDEMLAVTVIGTHRIGERETWQLRFEQEGRIPADRFFEQETGLLVETRVHDPKPLAYSYEYSELDGCLFATKITCRKGSTSSPFGTLEIHEVDFECDHDDIDFAPPAKIVEQSQLENSDE